MINIQKNSLRFQQLFEAVKEGWEIDQPVLLGAMWQSDSNESIYHFVLRNKVDDKTTLFSLPVSSQLLAFLTENNIQVNVLG